MKLIVLAKKLEIIVSNISANRMIIQRKLVV